MKNLDIYPGQNHVTNMDHGGTRGALRLLMVIFFLLNAIQIKSQNDSLVSYLNIAAKNSPALRQKLLEYEAALQKVPQVGALQDPELSLGVFLKPMEVVEGKQVADITLMQMFPWFGVLRNAKDEMSLMANAKFEEFRDSKLKLFYDVQKTWYDLYRLRKNISVSEKNVKILRSIENLAIIRYRTVSTGSSPATPRSSGSGASQSPGGGSGGMSGMSGNSNTSPAANQAGQPSMQNNGSMGASSGGTNLSDLYRIKIEISDLENNIALFKDQENSVLAGFNSMLNRTPLRHVFTPDTLIIDSLKFQLAEVNDSMKARNPMLSMIAYEKKSYDSRKKMVKAMGYPMLGLGVNYSVLAKNEMASNPDMNGNDMIMPMVRMTLPIYRKKYKAMQKEADLLSQSATEKLTSANNDLQSEFYQAVQMYQSARRRISLYDEQYQLASKTLSLVLNSFSTSGSDLTDVLRVRQQTLDYELNREEAAADLNTSVAWLKRLMASSDLQ